MSEMLGTAKVSAFRPFARLERIGASFNEKLDMRAAELERAGRPAILLGSGEQIFNAPNNFIKAVA